MNENQSVEQEVVDTAELTTKTQHQTMNRKPESKKTTKARFARILYSDHTVARMVQRLTIEVP